MFECVRELSHEVVHLVSGTIKRRHNIHIRHTDLEQLYISMMLLNLCFDCTENFRLKIILSKPETNAVP